MDIQGLPILLTGAASGIGAKTAKTLSELGAKLALCDVKEDELKTVATETNSFYTTCDVTSENSVEKAIQATKENLGTPRVCINCAGIIIGSRIVSKNGPMSFDNFKKVIDVNLSGSFNVMRLIASEMMQLDPINNDGERGLIINTASIAAFEGQIGQVAYSASKAGVIGMTLPAAREFSKFGIRVVAIAPGLIQTPMLEGLPEKAYQSLVSSTLFPKRLGLPEEFAKLSAHIIDNPLINGEVIRLDGGVRLQAV